MSFCGHVCGDVRVLNVGCSHMCLAVCETRMSHDVRDEGRSG